MTSQRRGCIGAHEQDMNDTVEILGGSTLQCPPSTPPLPRPRSDKLVVNERNRRNYRNRLIQAQATERQASKRKEQAQLQEPRTQAHL
jgi:hypothetical protein